MPQVPRAENVYLPQNIHVSQQCVQAFTTKHACSCQLRLECRGTVVCDETSAGDVPKSHLHLLKVRFREG